MQVVLAAVNAKYTHSSLALRYLKEYCSTDFPDVLGVEYNINQDPHLILTDWVNHKPDILGISCYIWNIELVLDLIKQFRKVSPQTTIILGGPEVSFDTEFWLNKYPEIDYIIAGEGEEALLSFLNAYQTAGGKSPLAVDNVPGLVYRVDGQVVQNAQQPVDLSTIPSVYTGSLDELEHKIVYYETTRGCPYKCAYCLSSVMGRVRTFPLERTLAELQRLAAAEVEQIRFVDRTFNYDGKRAFKLIEFMIGLETTTRFQLEISGDILTPDVLELLKKAPPGRLQFEIGVQSTNLATLASVDRRQNLSKLKDIVRFLREQTNVRLLLDLIAGLPHESYARFGESFDFVYNLRPHKIHLGFLKLLRGSRLRAAADSFACVYTNRAPYEVLETKDISFPELAHLHVVDDLVEKYVNSQKFTRTLQYLIGDRSAFGFFHDFATKWTQANNHWVNHSLTGLYRKLFDFYRATHPAIAEYLRWDYRMHEPKRTMPPFLGGTNERSIANSLIQSGEIYTIVPGLEDLSPREIGRRIFVEQFLFDGKVRRYLFYFGENSRVARSFRL